ncbi:MAG: hypothetical protein IJ720_03040 [Clostridia bacterium]|nr:hypothetical protein [Clostridia bacterium]MBR1704321.1 hypothetical protein [Clostridia bacterium]
MGNLFAALPQVALKYSYLHSEYANPGSGDLAVTDPTAALGPEALAIPSGNALYDILTIISGLFWTLVYIILIYKGFKDKTCGMPLFVLGLNWAWEFQMGFLGEPFINTDGTFWGISTAHGVPQRVWDCIWFIFDCILLYLKFKYGKKEFKDTMPHIPDKLWIPYIIFILFISFWFVFFSVYEWHDPNEFYAAYMQNFFISLLFIEKLFREGGVRGNGVNLWIAILKFLGTLAPSLLGALTLVNAYKLGLGTPSMHSNGALNITWMPFTKFLILNVTLMDIFYIIMVYRTMKREGMNPWSFFADKPGKDGYTDEVNATEEVV